MGTTFGTQGEVPLSARVLHKLIELVQGLLNQELDVFGCENFDWSLSLRLAHVNDLSE